MKNFTRTTLKAALLLLFVALVYTGCKKSGDPEIPSTVTDVDGNTYNVIVIGKQGWMKENLRVEHFNDGAVIPNITGATEWAALTSGAWCDYNNSTSNGTAYGKLYNGFAVETGKLCPEGWRVPTSGDWTELRDFLGGRNVAGGKIRQVGTSLWKAPNEGATNSSEFTALPGGFRGPNGLYYMMSEIAMWWSSSTSADKLPYWITSYTNLELVENNPVPKTNGIAVRCIWEQ